MWCPRCEQGEIVKAMINQNKSMIYVCEECEATWFNQADINEKSFLDFGTYMMSINLQPLWSELTVPFIDE